MGDDLGWPQRTKRHAGNPGPNTLSAQITDAQITEVQIANAQITDAQIADAHE
jgi:hypothetical protein